MKNDWVGNVQDRRKLRTHMQQVYAKGWKIRFKNTMWRCIKRKENGHYKENVQQR